MSYLINKEDNNLFKEVYDFAGAHKVTVYLVGGYLRDLLLKRQKTNPDMDFCIKKGAISFGRQLAKNIEADFVVLDEEHGCCRLLKRIGSIVYTLDFTDFRGKTLSDDLLLRDFTIDALAIELEAVFERREWNKSFIDACNARQDFKLKLIRAISEKSFDDDPLRILRAFSLSSIFGFKIEQKTLRWIKLNKDKLSGVSFERIRDELFKILERTDSVEYLLTLDKLKILRLIIPEIEVMRGINQGPYHHLNVLDHSFETVKQLEGVIHQKCKDEEIKIYLDEVFSGERRRRSLLKFAALLHDIGKPQAKRRKAGKTMFHGHEGIGARAAINIARRLKFSNDEIDALRKMIFWHLRPGYLADNVQITPRAKFRYFRDTADEGVSILLLSIADQRATKGRLTSEVSRLHHEKVVTGLIKEYFERKGRKIPQRLLTGDNLIKEFRLEPGPVIGRILSQIEELQAIGRVKTKAEALERAKKILSR